MSQYLIGVWKGAVESMDTGVAIDDYDNDNDNDADNAHKIPDSSSAPSS